MSLPFAIRCCSCQSIWEAESLSTLIQCPFCMAMLELAVPAATNELLDHDRCHELRWELARVMTIQAIARWRQRLLAEQPHLIDLPHEPQARWWTDQRIVWRGITIAIVLGLSAMFAPWQLTLALTTAVSYAIVINPGWSHDERARQTASLRQQTAPLLLDLPRAEFAPGGRYADVPFDGMAWLQSAWGSYRNGELFQILGWQHDLLQEISQATTKKTADSPQPAGLSCLHETRLLATTMPE